MLQAFNNFQAPLPPKVIPAVLPALTTVLLVLLSGVNQGKSSSGGGGSSSNFSTNASSRTSALFSGSAPSGTNDYVPLESTSDGPAACRFTRSQSPRPKKRARPKSTGKRATSGRMIPMLETPPLPSLLYKHVCVVCNKGKGHYLWASGCTERPA